MRFQQTVTEDGTCYDFLLVVAGWSCWWYIHRQPLEKQEKVHTGTYCNIFHLDHTTLVDREQLVKVLIFSGHLV